MNVLNWQIIRNSKISNNNVSCFDYRVKKNSSNNKKLFLKIILIFSFITLDIFC